MKLAHLDEEEKIPHVLERKYIHANQMLKEVRQLKQKIYRSPRDSLM